MLRIPRRPRRSTCRSSPTPGQARRPHYAGAPADSEPGPFRHRLRPGLRVHPAVLRPEARDIILNPLDERCPYWGPAEELRRKAEANAIAASLYQPTSDKKGEFFSETPQKIFAHLLTYGPTPQQLVEWMSKPAEIDQRVHGTEMEAMIAKGAQQQRNGVLASLGLVADSLRMLPTKEQAKNKTGAQPSGPKHGRDGSSLPPARPSARR